MASRVRFGPRAKAHSIHFQYTTNENIHSFQSARQVLACHFLIYAMSGTTHKKSVWQCKISSHVTVKKSGNAFPPHPCSHKRLEPIPWASAEIFPGGQNRHFAYPFQFVDDATQTDVHKTLHPFSTTKKKPNVTATVAYSLFPRRKCYTKQMFVSVSIDILRLS